MTDTTDPHLPPKSRDVPTSMVRHPRGRRLLTYIVATTTLVAVFAIALGALTSLGNTWSRIGVIVVAAEVVLLFAGLAWLALLVTLRPRGGETAEETKPGPKPPPADRPFV